VIHTDIVSDVHITGFNLSNLVQSHFIIYAKRGFRRDKGSKTDRGDGSRLGYNEPPKLAITMITIFYIEIYYI